MGGRKLLGTALKGGVTEEVVKDLKEGEEIGWLRGAVRTDISGKGHGMFQSMVEQDIPGATTDF